MNLLALLPAMMLGVVILLVMLSIALKRCHKTAATLSALGLITAFVLTILQLIGTLPKGAVGGLFVLDGFALVNGALVLLSALVCVALSYDYFVKSAEPKEELYLLLLTATLGGLLLVSASHLASLFVALELSSVPMYGMLAFSLARARSLEAGIKYLVLSATASAMLLMGMALILASFGVMGFSDILRVAGMGLSPFFVLGGVLILSAAAFKLSLAPFHTWAADVYQGAPAPVTAFLGSVSKVAMVAVLVRFLLQTALPSLVVIDYILLLLITLSVLVGNVLALRQKNLKRLLAYSSIAHMGYVLMAVATVGLLADYLTTMYMVVYALTTLAAFGVIGLMSGSLVDGAADEIGAYQGLFWRRPLITAVFSVTLLSLAGIPFTAGFMTKIQLMLALVQSGRFWLAGLLIVGSAVSLFYYLNTILVLYKRPIGDGRVSVARCWRQRAGGFCLLVITALLLWWGVLPSSLYELAMLARLGG